MSGSKKYSISLPRDLAEAMRETVGRGGFSAYVAEALDQRLAMDKLRQIIADFETDNAPPRRPRSTPRGPHWRITAPPKVGPSTGGTRPDAGDIDLGL